LLPLFSNCSTDDFNINQLLNDTKTLEFDSSSSSQILESDDVLSWTGSIKTDDGNLSPGEYSSSTKCDWVSVSIIDDYHYSVSVTQNDTGKERSSMALIYYLSYRNHIVLTINQKSTASQ